MGYYCICNGDNLQHHGIKGQKWGVRRFQNKDESLTPAGKERYVDNGDSKRVESPEERKKRIARNVAIGAAAVTVAIAAIGYMKYGKNLKELDKIARQAIKEINTNVVNINNLSDDTKILKKGTKFQRISSKSFEEYAEKGRIAYASFNKKDNSIYMHDMPKNIEKWRRHGIIKDGGNSAYKHVMTMNKDIKVASAKKVAVVYSEVTGKTIFKNYEFRNFMQGLVDRDNDENKKFINKLIDMGYNAIIDDNDAGSYTTSPLILLNPASDIANIDTKEIKKIHKILNVLMYK